MVTDRDHLIEAERAPFHTLIKLIERELELAEAGEIVALREAIAQTGAYIATLPHPAPASARSLVLHAEAMRGRVTVLTERQRDQLTIARTARRRGRKIARRYGKPVAGRISTTA
jgi:hypothetical protein